MKAPIAPEAADELAEPRQARVEQRVAVTHGEGQEEARQRHHDRDGPPTPEEAEIGRQLDGVVSVEEPRREQTDQDPREHAVVDLRLLARLVDLTREHDRGHGLEHGLHHEVADHCGQCGGTVRLLGETDGHTDGEEQGQIAEDRVPGSAHRLEEGSDDGRLDPAEQIVLTQPEQDSCRRQYRDRQHEALAEALELSETGDA